MSKIEDFGEKIHGARKDAHQKWIDRTTESASAEMSLIYSQPLSVTWPEPNYQRLNQQVTLPIPVIDWMRAARDEVGAKPSASQRGRLQGWGLRVKAYLSATNALIAKDWGGETVTPDEVNYLVSNVASSAIKKEGFAPINLSLGPISARAMCYNRWGHETSFRTVRFAERDMAYLAQTRKSAREISRAYESTSWSEVILLMREQNDYFKSLTINNAATNTSDTKRKESEVKLRLIGKSGSQERFIAVKHKGEWVEIERFENSKEAREAAKDPDNFERWGRAFRAWRDQAKTRFRNNENAPREGRDWRGGENISPEEFSDAFGFRGVQFGNYVEGERRQDDLNNAYDGLMDMAWVLDISPRSLSLDGTLGLAFGARGKGGINAASAHYEPDNKVINLTKTKGAGSLAHEWFHAFDNFIGDQGNELGAGSYHTNKLNQRLNTLTLNALNEQSPSFKSMGASLKGVTDLLFARSVEMDKKRSGSDYWSSVIEIAARSFEAGIKEALRQQGCHNDYLVNVIDEELWEGFSSMESNSLLSKPCYPYPKESEKEKNASLILDLVETMCAQSPVFDDTFQESEVESHAYQHHFEAQQAVKYREQSQLF